MCELLGISAAAPVSARFSLRRLAGHGRTAGEPIDGWGEVLYDHNDVRCYREPELARISHRVLPTIGGLTLAMRRGRIGCVGVGT